jgi:hypothetical protein
MRTVKELILKVQELALGQPVSVFTKNIQEIKGVYSNYSKDYELKDTGILTIGIERVTDEDSWGYKEGHHNSENLVCFKVITELATEDNITFTRVSKLVVENLYEALDHDISYIEDAYNAVELRKLQSKINNLKETNKNNNQYIETYSKEINKMKDKVLENETSIQEYQNKLDQLKKA